MKEDEFNQSLEGYRLRLNVLVKRHKKSKLALPKKSRSRKWAIWLLQGGSLSLCKHVLKLAGDGNNFAFLSVYLRLSSEITEQVRYFANKDVSIDEIGKWFNRNDAIIFNCPDDAFISNRPVPRYTGFKSIGWEGQRRLANNFLSGYAHPSYDLVKHLFSWSSKKGSLDFYSLNMITQRRSKAILMLASFFVDQSEAAMNEGKVILE